MKQNTLRYPSVPEALESRIAPAAVINVADVSVSENLGIARFVVTLSEPSTVPVTFQYETLDITATGGPAFPADYRTTVGMLGFLAGETRKEVMVPVYNDATVEPTETFTVRLKNAVGAELGDHEATGTITNDDAVGTNPTISVTSASIHEGAEGTRDMVFNVRLSVATATTTSVHFATTLRAMDLASADDFIAVDGDLVFAPGETVKQIVVKAIGDTAVESNETFAVVLSAPVGGRLGEAMTTGLITNDDGPTVPGISITPAMPAAEGNSGTRNAVFTAVLSTPQPTPVTVQYRTLPGSAGVDDFVMADGTLTFAPGQTQLTVPIAINGDTTVEPNENFFFQLLNATGAAASGTGFASTMIVNDDSGVAPLTVNVSPAGANASGSIQEGASDMKEFLFKVKLSAASTTPVSVHYATANATGGYVPATAGEDYVSVAGDLTFAPGEVEKTVAVLINGDTLMESSEAFALVLSGATGAALGTGTSVATIVNDDHPPQPFIVNIAGVTAQEGNDGAKNFVFRFTLSTAATAPVTVNYATGDVSSTMPRATVGEDYDAVSGTLTFAPGERVKEVAVSVKGDTTAEPNEYFDMLITGFEGVTPGSNLRAAGIIVNDDAVPLSVGIAGGSIQEGHDGSQFMNFRVLLSAAAMAPVTVHFATADSVTAAAARATAGEDYVALDGDITFEPGQREKIVTVAVKGDRTVEQNEQLAVVLSNAVGAVIAGTGTALGTIINDDFNAPVNPQLMIHNAAILEGNDGTRDLVFRVRLTSPASGEVTVNFTTADGPESNRALAGEDYVATSGTLTFAPGQLEKTVVVKINGDTVAETDEAFFVQLSNAVGAELGAARKALATIVNDDSAGDTVIIHSNRRVATWTDTDGDLVMLTISHPVLDAADFVFTAVGSGIQVDAILLGDDADARGASINIAARHGFATGDGQVSIGEIDASGLDLGGVYISGDIGSISAGDSDLKTMGLMQLNVRSILESAEIEGLVGGFSLRGNLPGSVSINGTVYSIFVHGKVTGDIDITGSLRHGQFGSIENASLITGEHIDNLRVGADAVGSQIAAGGIISNVRITGALRDSTVSAVGRGDLAIRGFAAGSVESSDILAGYAADGANVRSDASIGEVIVRGNWASSSLIAGAITGADNVFGTEDDDYTAGATSLGRIGALYISGSIADAPDGENYGIVASAIRAVRIGTNVLPLTANLDVLTAAIGITVREVTAI